MEFVVATEIATFSPFYKTVCVRWRVCVSEHMQQGMHVAVKGRLLGAGSFLLPLGF